MPAVAEPGRQRINLPDPFGNRCDRFINHDVAGRFDNFEVGNVTILFDPNFYQRRNLRVRRDRRRGLRPFTVEPIVQHGAIPSEFGCAAPAFAAASAFGRAAVAIAVVSSNRFSYRFLG
ncbi:MAG: hypothetical protein QOG67_2514 [Verrucomicrobiota bacterium]